MENPRSELVIPSSGQLVRPAPFQNQRETEEAAATSEDPWEKSAAWRERWIRSKPLDSTKARYREGFASLEAYAALIGKAPLALERNDVDVWREVLAKAGNPSADEQHRRPLSEATVARHMATASSFYRYCLEFDKSGVLRNPVPGRDGRPPVSKQSNQRVPTKTEVQRILRVADKDGAHSAAFLGLLLACLRVSEAAGARITDLAESDGHRILRVTRKGQKTQDVPLPPDVWTRVERAVGNRTTGPIVAIPTRERGTWDGLTRGALGSRVGTLARRAEIKGRVTPHTFRHFAITAALKKHPLHVVQAWAGHENPATTERYWHESQNLSGSPGYDVIADLYSDLYDDGEL